MTWLTAFYLRAFVIFTQVALIYSDENGPMPGFNQQPADTLIELSNQTIFCSVKGEKPLHIAWRKDNIDLDKKLYSFISISSEGALSLFNTNRKRDEGEYRCVVNNKYGTVISHRAKVTFPYMNEFSALDSTISAEEGEQVLLPCHAPDSYPDRNIYWSKSISGRSFQRQLESSSHHSISETGDLYFAYATRNDTGVYYCSVENNNLRKVLKRVVVLSVRPKVNQKNISPKVWVFSDQIAMKDSNFMMECIAYGRPIPSMTFRNLITGKELQGSRQEGNRLRHEFGRFEGQDEGEYACEVKNIYGETSSKTAYMRMEAKPTLKTRSKTISEAVDSSVTIPCRAVGTPGVHYIWYRNGKRISINEPGMHVYKGNLTIYRIMKEHEGFYQCVASNRHGEALMTIRLIVKIIAAGFGRESIKPAETTHVLVGDTAEILCVPTGAPKPIIKWRRKNGTSENLQKDSRVSISSTGTLRIKNIKMSDAGEYECVVSNKLGSEKASGIIVVKDGLVITEDLIEHDTVIIGNTIRMKCKVSTVENKEVIFRWYRGSKLNKRKLKKGGRINIIDEKLKRQSILEIKNSQSTDTGIYSCQVYGPRQRSDFRKQMVLVTGPPNPPLDVKASEQTDGTNIKISWTKNLNNGQPVTKIYIEARTAFDLDSWHIIKISNKTTKYRENEIVSLSPWVEYKIRVIAENAYGKSRPSIETEKWIKTPTAKPTKFPTELKGVGTGPNEITVSFKPLDLIDQNAPGIEYIVYYKEKYSVFDSQQIYVPKLQNTVKILLRNSDAYYKPYEIQIQAKNLNGFGPVSPEVTAYTGERFPLGISENLHVQIISATSAIARWDDVDRSRKSMRGKFLGYKLLYWRKELPGHPRSEQYASTKNNEITITLKPYTEYCFQVVVFNSVGDGPDGKIVGPYKTPEGRPSKPANFKILEAKDGEATLSWNEPLHKNGKLVKYNLIYRVLDNGKRVVKDIHKDERILVLTDLISNARYSFSLSASTGAGTGPEEEIEFDFSKIPITTPEKPNIASVGYNAIVLTWTPLPYKNITGYKVYYWVKGDSRTRQFALWERNDDVVTTIPNLEQDTLYNFQIAAVNAYGTGPRSAISQARTRAKIEEVNAAGSANHSSHSRTIKFKTYILLLVTLVAVLIPR